MAKKQKKAVKPARKPAAKAAKQAKPAKKLVKLAAVKKPAAKQNGNGLPKWPEYKDLTNGRVMVLGDTVQVESAPAAAKLSFYQAAYQRLLKSPNTGTN